MSRQPDPLPLTLQEIWSIVSGSAAGDLLRFAWRDRALDSKWYTWTGKIVAVLVVADGECGTLHVRFPATSHRLPKANHEKIVEWPSLAGRSGKLDYAEVTILADILDDPYIATPPPELALEHASTGLVEPVRKRLREDHEDLTAGCWRSRIGMQDSASRWSTSFLVYESHLSSNERYCFYIRTAGTMPVPPSSKPFNDTLDRYHSARSA